MSAATGADLSVKSVSVRQLPGNHLTQPTAGARPQWSDYPPAYANMDGVDDYLRAVFPALGSACTVATIAPGGSPSITGGQTISGNYDVSTDFHRHVVVDRALTGAEATLVTAWLNEGATP